MKTALFGNSLPVEKNMSFQPSSDFKKKSKINMKSTRRRSRNIPDQWKQRERGEGRRWGAERKT